VKRANQYFLPFVSRAIRGKMYDSRDFRIGSAAWIVTTYKRKPNVDPAAIARHGFEGASA